MKETTADRDPEAVATLRELIADISVAMVTSATADGALRSRPMFTQDHKDGRELWFFTSDDSGLVHDIEEEKAVNVVYADPPRDRFVSVTGQASLVRDRAKVQELWDRKLERYFPQGLHDPRLCLMRVRIESAEYWDEDTNRMMGVTDGTQPSEDGHVKVGIRAARASG